MPDTTVTERTGAPASRSAIAVIGAAGRFPQAPSIDQLWQLLLDERDAVTGVPPERWDTSGPLDPTVVVPDRAGFLDGVRSFDPQFFGISPREAENMDPQQRLMLEVCWESLEDAGQRASTIRGSRTGVYVGALWHDYETLERRAGVNTQYTALGQALDVIAARLNYFLGLTGPSLTLQTGCSSSLVALHLAVQALRGGEIDAAFAAGINLVLAPDDSISLTHFGGLSADGHCHAFGSKANGFARAEGAICVYLKRFDDAVAAGDRIVGVIVDTAVNNDAGGDSLAAPNPDGQADLLRTVYDRGSVPPDDLVYLEAHGTGTYRGDPIEAGAIGSVVAARRSPGAGPLLIGSVKSNIGHLESAAGLAGLVKAMLVLRHRIVPRSLHSTELNPEIDFAGLRLAVPQSTIPLPADRVLYAGVNSFGWGGTNAHAVIRTPPPLPDPGPAPSGPVLLPVSAHTPSALDQRLGELADLLEARPSALRDIADTLAFERDHFAHRAAALGSAAGDCADTLRQLAGKAVTGRVPGAAGEASTRGRLCFVLPGQGSQWATMGANLYNTEPVFRAEIDLCREALRPFTDWDIVATLIGPDEEWLQHVDQVQPALWAMSLGLAALWRAAGVEPDVVIGHSQGEVTAATIAGILTREDAAQIIAVRSRMAIQAAGRGRMLAVDLPLEEARGWLAGFEAQVSIAVHNGSRSCVLSGDTDEVLLLRELLEAEEVFCRLVQVDYASHSHHMDPLLAPLTEALAPVSPRPGTATFLSTVTETVLDGITLDAGYWAANLRSPVMFLGALQRAVELGVTHFLEISPHPILGHAVASFATEQGGGLVSLTSVRRDEAGPGDFLRALAAAYVSGLEPFGRTARRPGAGLPGYPWQRRDFWLSGGSRARGEGGGLEPTTTPVPGELDTVQARARLSTGALPWAGDHQVHGATVFPAVGLLALACTAARSHTGSMPGSIEDARFVGELSLPEAGVDVCTLLAEDLPGSAAVRVMSLDAVWTTNATARIGYSTASLNDVTPFPAELLARSPEASEPFYAGCSGRGLNYGPAFRGIEQLWQDEARVLARVIAPSGCRPTLRPGELHPAVWDAALQTSLTFVPPGRTVVPTRVRRTRLALPADRVLDEVWALARHDRDGEVEVVVYDADRRPLAVMNGIELQVIDGSPHGGGADGYLRMDWRTSTVQPVARDGKVAVVSPVAARAEEVAAALLTCGIDAHLGRTGDAERVVFVAPTAADGLDAQRAGLDALARCARALTARGASRLFLVTEGARPDRGGDSDPGAGLYWGFGRVLRREHPELDGRLVDLPQGEAVDRYAGLVAELGLDDGEDQVVRLVGGERLVARLAQGLPADPAPVPAASVPTSSFRLRPAPTGLFDDLAFWSLPRPAVPPGAVEVGVSAAALNFIDVMKTVGTYPDGSAGADLIGGEAVGVVTRVGEGTSKERIGERVAACAFGAVASSLVVRADHTVPVPARLDDASAAALPLVCATAWYGLVDLGRLAPGETVLVHSAAGGLGMAAVLLARAMGATVIATAGTAEKQAMLRDLGIEHVFGSRDLGWTEGVAAATGARGVDVVLNSLCGAHIEAGVQALAEDGRFIEVGKKDIYAGRRLALTPFSRGISFAAVDIAGLMARRPERFATLLREVWAAVAEGVFDAMPVSRRPFAQAAEALRDMSRGRHTGKFVLVDPGTVHAVAPRAVHDGRFRDDGTYLITGGLGALGVSLAEFLVERGARSLALLGRSAPGEPAAAVIATLRSRGADVDTYAVDVGDVDGLAGVLDRVRLRRPLVGVIHAAGLLDDAIVQTVSAEQIERVLRPKVDGARNLDRLTAADPLDLFITFSSVAGLVGNPGQAAYAAANVYLDCLAQHRLYRGRPALSVQWGPFQDIGLAATDSLRGDRLADQGLTGFGVDDAWPTLAGALQEPWGVLGYAPLEPRLWFEAYPETAAQPSWQAVRDAAQTGSAPASAGGFLDLARSLSPQELDERIRQVVSGLVGRVLRLDEDSIEPRVPFKALGLDSLMGLELRNRLEGAVGLRLSPTLLWTYGSLDALVEPLRCMVLDAVARADADDAELVLS